MPFPAVRCAAPSLCRRAAWRAACPALSPTSPRARPIPCPGSSVPAVAWRPVARSRPRILMPTPRGKTRKRNTVGHAGNGALRAVPAAPGLRAWPEPRRRAERQFPFPAVCGRSEDAERRGGGLVGVILDLSHSGTERAMILFVDMESPGLVRHDAPLAARMAAHTATARDRIAALSGVPCTIVPHARFTPDLPRRLGAEAVVIGGHFTEVSAYPAGARAGALASAAAPDRPVLGICGGHQLIAEAHGMPAGPISDAPQALAALPPIATFDPEGEPHESAVGRLGMLEVEVLQPTHPLMAGLGRRPRMLHMHYWHVPALPAGFSALARSRDGVLQAMAHESLPIHGAQFHPEGFTEAHPDGAALLGNFVRLARGGRAPAPDHGA